MHKSFSAGGVVIGPEGNVLVVNQDGQTWSLPKGHIDPGESARQAAEREIKEESGVATLKFIKEIGSYERFRLGRDGIGEDTTDLKHMTFFLYTTDQWKLAPEDPNNPEARWIVPDAVADLLSHPKDKEFFISLLPEVKSIVG